MQVFNYVLVAILAICATQCQAEEFPISSDKVDLRLFVENGAAIARNMFKAVNTGLDQSKPNMDKILNELAPEAKSLIRKVIDEARAKMNEEEKRADKGRSLGFTLIGFVALVGLRGYGPGDNIGYIFYTLNKTLDALKPIKTCSDKVSPAAKKLALATEKGIAKAVQEIQTKYKKEIENIEIGTEKVITKARTLFDTEVVAVVKCLTPGRKDANECLNKEVDKIMAGIKEVVYDIVILVQTAEDSILPILPELLEKLAPLLEETIKAGRVLLKTLADCVANLK